VGDSRTPALSSEVGRSSKLKLGVLRLLLLLNTCSNSRKPGTSCLGADYLRQTDLVNSSNFSTLLSLEDRKPSKNGRKWMEQPLANSNRVEFLHSNRDFTIADCFELLSNNCP